MKKFLVALSLTIAASFTIPIPAHADMICKEENGQVTCKDDCSVICKIGKAIGNVLQGLG